MSMQELWQIKETMSEKLWGKSAEEICALLKTNADEMKRRIDTLRQSDKGEI